MEYKHNFAGISSNGDIPFNDEFDIVDDYGYELVAVSKDEYKCYLGSKTVNYRIAVRFQNGSEFDMPGKMFVEVDLVPAFRSLHRKNRDDMIKNYAYEYGSDPVKYGKKDDMRYYSDAVSYGMSVVLSNEEYDCDSEDEYDMIQNEVMADISNTYICMTGLSGFFLDRPTNMLGMNGWDWLRQLCNGVSMSTILKDIKKRYVS